MGSPQVTTEILLYLETAHSQKKMDSVRSNYWSPAQCPGPVPRLRNVVASFSFSGSASIKSEHVPQSDAHRHAEDGQSHPLTLTSRLHSSHTQDSHRQRHRQTSPLLLMDFSHRYPKIVGLPTQKPGAEAPLLSIWLRLKIVN